MPNLEFASDTDDADDERDEDVDALLEVLYEPPTRKQEPPLACTEVCWAFFTVMLFAGLVWIFLR